MIIRKSLSRTPVDTSSYIKKSGRKGPDRQADSCKRSNVNWIAAGSRLFRCDHGVFLLPA